jgi:uncharacterized protein YyaL (SSP411 family)
MPNRLAAESSPYLRQHAGNPVDWYPWGQEAFDRAVSEQKPIFLSVGYSTCHWCHVMEHESFEDARIAEQLNASFVSIKVDREERPDVDRVYMTFVQATTGQGGWPMSVWLTPDLQPFYGGTYFPPASQWGRPGFGEVLSEIARLWREERARVLASADTIVARLRSATAGGRLGRADRDNAVAGPPAIAEGAHQYVQAFDQEWGGFGTAPKFPRPSELLFLLRAYATTGDTGLLEIVQDTLRAMALGGMRDHVGGGFHRYSVDREWRVPHFEKMLYDQAQLVIALLEAAQASGDAFWRWVADDTLEYVRRDLADPGGGFHSAEDADSVPPEAAAVPGVRKTEGAFYLWTAEELERLLGSDADVVKRRFGIDSQGNAPHDPHGEFTGKNLLYTAASIEEIARATGRSDADVVEVLNRARESMFAARAARPRPHLDDKVLTSWNGLAIAALARAARVLDDPEFDGTGGRAMACLESAERAAGFLRRHLWDAGAQRLLRRYRQGEAAIEAFGDDYACLAWGLLELFQATGAVEWLDWADALQRRHDALFWDEADGGWFDTTGQDPSVLLRLKEDYDGAEPAAGSVAIMNLLTLSHLVPGGGRAERASRALARYGPHLGQAARVVPLTLASLAAYHAGLTQVVIVGPRGRPDTAALRHEVARRYLPFAVVVPVEPGGAQTALSRVLPWIHAMGEIGGRSAAYVCRGFACQRPVTEPGELGGLLDAGSTREASRGAR